MVEIVSKANPIERLPLRQWVQQERKRLYKGCGGYESYGGHECKSTFINTSNKKVTVYCDRCRAEIDLLKRILKEVRFK